MRIISDPKLDFDDVLIIPKRSTLTSRKNVSVERTFKMKWSSTEWSGVPIFGANMDGVGVIEVANVIKQQKLPTALHKHYTVTQLVDMFHVPDPYIWYSLGITDSDYTKFNDVEDLIKKIWSMYPHDPATVPRLPLPYICVDIANGYTEGFVKFITRLRDNNPQAIIMAGNVVTPEITEQLILAGADIVKVGIGPGSVCTTRKMTGIGYPQLSAIIECADAAHGLGGLICGDGGCKVPGDVVKAFAGGADFVMLGGMFAGHIEGGGKIIDSQFPVKPDIVWNRPTQPKPWSGLYSSVDLDKKSYVVNAVDFLGLVDGHATSYTKQDYYMMYPWAFDIEPTAKIEFYGMSSDTAQEKHNGGVAQYKASEGKRVLIPFKGRITDTVQDILGGIRSACTYVGATTLKQLSKRTTFVLVNRQLNSVFNQYEA